MVRRDSTATVAAAGSGMQKRLLVNGVGMTHLTPITKMMAHLPLAFRAAPPTRGTLVICLGMGTTLRSALSWQAPATAVELIPSVVELAPYFHADARRLFASPLARIVVDDGRRFLARSSDSLRRDRHRSPAARLRGGIESALLDGVLRRGATAAGEARHSAAVDSDRRRQLKSTVVAAVTESFRHVRLFGSIEGWGLHILASQEPIAAPDGRRARGAAAAGGGGRPPGVGPGGDGRRAVPSRCWRTEIALESIAGAQAMALRDDRPVNEYFFLHERRTRARGGQDRPPVARARRIPTHLVAKRAPRRSGVAQRPAPN